jgi:UDP-N-acetylglucosamine transferase subunit ALG13
MIFVTVGTHEQPFNRLIKQIDLLVKAGLINENVFMQIGYSTYKPKYCDYSEFVDFNQMDSYLKDSHIVICHGGPSTFLVPVQNGSVPIVVPRQKKFNEHVNDHQLQFCREVEKRVGGIIVVEDISEIENVIRNYATYSEHINSSATSNNLEFNKRLTATVKQLLA